MGVRCRLAAVGDDLVPRRCQQEMQIRRALGINGRRNSQIDTRSSQPESGKWISATSTKSLIAINVTPRALRVNGVVVPRRGSVGSQLEEGSMPLL